MKITRLRTTNFRQHKNIDLDFSDEKSDFVIIKGKNGAGKTNLLNAITWCLYGVSDDIKNKDFQLLSDSEVLNIEIGNYRDVNVQLDLALPDGTNCYVNRKQTFKNSEGIIKPYGDSELVVQVQRSVQDGFQVEANPSLWVQKNLPSRFRPYFLFDGEKLENFFKESDAPRIKSAIQEVAKIDTLFRMQDVLQGVSAHLTQKAAKLSGTQGDLLSGRHEELISRLSAKENQILELEEQLRENEDLEQKYDVMLSGMKDIESNISRKRAIDNEVEIKRRELVSAKADFHELMRKVTPATLLSDALRELGKAIESARSNRVLPPPIAVEYIQELIDHKKCICGDHLQAGGEQLNTLLKLIENYESVSEIGSALNEHASSYLVELGKLPALHAHIDTQNKNIISKSNYLKSLAQEQADLSKALEGQDDKEISELAKLRAEVRTIAANQRHALASVRAEVSTMKIAKHDIEAEIRRQADKNEEGRLAQKKAQFAREAAKTAFDLYEKMNAVIRQNVSNSLESQFKEMAWKDSFSSVSIDQEFKVSVLNNYKIEQLDRLSAGERLCLAFAFSLTLSKEAGLSFPIVVDTPLGRLDPQVQENVATVLAAATQAFGSNGNHQLIMLVTETEYNEKVAKALDVRHPKVLEIVFDTETSETKVA
jgi:DNA sulfur modification protein DndD